MSRLATGVGAFVAAALLVACTSAPGASPPPTAGAPTVTPTVQPASPTPAPTEPPAATPTAVGGATQSPGGGEATFHPDTELVELFPDEIGGQAISPDSATGEQVVNLIFVGDEAEFHEFLADIGTTIDEISVARALAFVPGPTATELGGINILAVRVRGVPATSTIDRFVEFIGSTIPDATAEPATIAGKQVVALVDPADEAKTVFVYPVGDIVFMVGGTPNLVEETFAKLP